MTAENLALFVVIALVLLWVTIWTLRGRKRTQKIGTAYIEVVPRIRLWDKDMNYVATLDPDHVTVTGPMQMEVHVDSETPVDRIMKMDPPKDTSGVAGPTGTLVDGLVSLRDPESTLRGDLSSLVTNEDNPVELLIDMAENLGLRVEEWQARSMRSWWPTM